MITPMMVANHVTTNLTMAPAIVINIAIINVTTVTTTTKGIRKNSNKGIMTTRTDQGTATGTVTTSNKVTMVTNNRSTRTTSVQMNPWEATIGTIRREDSN